MTGIEQFLIHIGLSGYNFSYVCLTVILIVAFLWLCSLWIFWKISSKVIGTISLLFAILIMAMLFASGPILDSINECIKVDSQTTFSINDKQYQQPTKSVLCRTRTIGGNFGEWFYK